MNNLLIVYNSCVTIVLCDLHSPNAFVHFLREFNKQHKAKYNLF